MSSQPTVSHLPLPPPTPTDLIPGFGFSHTAAEFGTNTVQAIVCSLAGQQASSVVSGYPPERCTPWAPAWAVAMSAGYVISYIGDAVSAMDIRPFLILGGRGEGSLYCSGRNGDEVSTG